MQIRRALVPSVDELTWKAFISTNARFQVVLSIYN